MVRWLCLFPVCSSHREAINRNGERYLLSMVAAPFLNPSIWRTISKRFLSLSRCLKERSVANSALCGPFGSVAVGIEAGNV